MKIITDAGLDVVCQKVQVIALDELWQIDGLRVDLLTYYGIMAADLSFLHTSR